MIKRVDSGFDKTAWNARAPHPMQSWEWGEARAQMGIEVIRLGEFSGSSLKTPYQLTLHRLPHTPYKTGYLPRSAMPSEQIISYLHTWCKSNHIISVKIEPNVIAGVGPIDKRLIPSPTPLFPKWTQVIDLDKTEDELLKEMKPKTRYNIRLAQKKGIVVQEETTDEGFERFSELYFETTSRQRYFGHNKEYHRTVFDTLKGSIAHILIARYGETPLAAYELFLFNNVLYYPYGGSSNVHRELMAPNLLMWEAIRFGQSRGARSFDLWGSLPPGYASGHMWGGFTRFKEGYGAQFTEMIGSFDLIINPILYKGFIAAQKLREKLLF